jgi:hypothetical protein
MLVGDDRSPSAAVAWGWVCAQKWPTWSADVVTVTPPGHTLADL